ncbi:hypothetical protein O4H61_03750, partial [Roseovarius aestuarii]|nr:hypothetical protein [Roseovarius aestuarii]
DDASADEDVIPEALPDVTDALDEGLEVVGALTDPVLGDGGVVDGLLGDGGDDGFLDTLIAGDDTLFLTGSSDTLDGSGQDTVLDGLLGDDDVFGVDVEASDDSSDDLFAGLSGGGNLSGSLIDQGLLSLEPADAGSSADDEIDSLLNDILAGGVDDIFGDSSELGSLLDVDPAADDVPAQDGVDTLVDDTIIEGALNILFDQGVDQGFSLLGGLFGGTSEEDAN